MSLPRKPPKRPNGSGLGAALIAVAQALEVPQLSVRRGRTIWGGLGLVPYDQLWRTGANASSKFTASKGHGG